MGALLVVTILLALFGLLDDVLVLIFALVLWACYLAFWFGLAGVLIIAVWFCLMYAGVA